MSTLTQLISIFRKAAAFMLLPLLAWSCQWMTEDYDDELVDSSSEVPQYINITISVSAGKIPATRANPAGGEYGDGVEQGIDTRENEVKNITLIFYEDATGINTNSAEAVVACVKSYAVSRYSEGDLPAAHTHKAGESEALKDAEILYTTGDQELNGTTLQVGKTYKVLAVANGYVDVKAGDKITAVRDKVLTSIYSGSGVGTSATDFVMTSESDATISLTNPTLYTSTTVAAKNRFVYYFDCIHIERMAARIDYWAKNSNGYKTSYTDHPGYEYVAKMEDGTPSPDRFVLTSITPFNLNGGDEYLFKRTNDASNAYLADETTENWVVDPTTSSKTTASHPVSLLSPLTTVVSDMTGTYNVTMASQQTNKLTVSGSDNIILAYPKENTLTATTPLYYYATGLAFEGYYYQNGATTGGERRVYYYFIRHQGESDKPYPAMKAEELSTTATIGSSGTPMNFGIVRNNIYRVSIEGINATTGIIQIKIQEEKWRHVDNPTIYI